ncbi:unnamed protein product [Nyctereutes procyonoides]|uniref:(raccoon dog) hypothetical protein n=1 Tax=Nyctereutes procyonoides TaxID=34880 RepID=A0A811ZXJ9_NYCPR|nr:unnamed protein product [Nyctereutes procyonoides]
MTHSKPIRKRSFPKPFPQAANRPKAKFKDTFPGCPGASSGFRGRSPLPRCPAPRCPAAPLPGAHARLRQRPRRAHCTRPRAARGASCPPRPCPHLRARTHTHVSTHTVAGPAPQAPPGGAGRHGLRGAGGAGRRGPAGAVSPTPGAAPPERTPRGRRAPPDRRGPAGSCSSSPRGRPRSPGIQSGTGEEEGEDPPRDFLRRNSSGSWARRALLETRGRAERRCGGRRAWQSPNLYPRSAIQPTTMTALTKQVLGEIQQRACLFLCSYRVCTYFNCQNSGNFTLLEAKNQILQKFTCVKSK